MGREFHSYAVRGKMCFARKLKKIHRSPLRQIFQHYRPFPQAMTTRSHFTSGGLAELVCNTSALRWPSRASGILSQPSEASGLGRVEGRHPAISPRCSQPVKVVGVYELSRFASRCSLIYFCIVRYQCRHSSFFLGLLHRLCLMKQGIVSAAAAGGTVCLCCCQGLCCSGGGHISAAPIL